MHLADGALDLPTIGISVASTAFGLAIGLRKLTAQTLPIAALFAAVFFVVGTIHIPLGIGSVHLVLNGLIGVLLGWLAFPVIFVALALQALLFSFGGFTALGANTLLLATPGVLAHFIFRAQLRDPRSSQRQLMLIGAAAATIGIVGAVLITAALLWSTGQNALISLAVAIGIAQVPVWVIDAAVSALALAMLGRAMPRVFGLSNTPAR